MRTTGGEFEDVVFHLSPGQISDVFRTRFGFHVAKLYDRQPPALAPLTSIRGQIVDEVQEQKREQALGDYLDGLRSKATSKKCDVKMILIAEIATR
jgi:parvulin-like peptidyl-prolyl isomerase